MLTESRFKTILEEVRALEDRCRAITQKSDVLKRRLDEAERENADLKRQSGMQRDSCQGCRSPETGLPEKL